MKPTRPAAVIPSLVGERLQVWGKCIRKQRVAQNITALDLCQRIDISRPTLVRMERGEGSVAVALYLAAFHVLGLLEIAAPQPELSLWGMEHEGARAARRSDDADYF